MANNSMQLKVAESLLDDVFSNLNKMDSLDRQHQREALSKELLRDVGRAFTEIDKAAAQGADPSGVSYTKAKAHSAKGSIYCNVAASPELESGFTAIIINKQMRAKYSQSYTNKWARQGLAEFNKSLEIMPTQVVHFQSGQALFLMGRKQEAQAAFERAQQGDDQDIALDAAKAITRLNQPKEYNKSSIKMGVIITLCGVVLGSMGSMGIFNIITFFGIGFIIFSLARAR